MTKNIYSLFSERYQTKKDYPFWEYCTSYSNFNVFSEKCWKCPEKYERCLKNTKNIKRMPEYFFNNYSGRYKTSSILYNIKPEKWYIKDEELTKEVAVRLHRQMWDSIAKELCKTKFIINPFEWFDKMGYISYFYKEEINTGIPDFWPCKYAKIMQKKSDSNKIRCAFCPIKWPCEDSKSNNSCKCILSSKTSRGLFGLYLDELNYFEKNFVDKINFVSYQDGTTYIIPRIHGGVYTKETMRYFNEHPDTESFFDNKRYATKRAVNNNYYDECYFDYSMARDNAYFIAKKISELPMKD